MPALHQHLLDARHVQIVLLARGSVAPAPSLPPAPETGSAYLAVQVKLDLPVIEHHRKLCAAGMEVKPTFLAVVHEARHVFLASVAVTWDVTRRAGQELEGAPGVERVEDDGGGRRRWRHGAVHVEIVVANAAAAFVTGTDANFLAPVTLERNIRVFKFELVLWVAEVGNLVIFHGYSL